MSDSFGRVAVRHAAFAARVLGWRPGEFWAATPAELMTALGLLEADAGGTIDRAALQRMMETDDDRPG